MANFPSTTPQQDATLKSGRITPKGRANSRIGWWYRLSAPAGVVESANFTIREQYRRGRVASLIILGTLCAILLLLPIIILYAPVPFNLPGSLRARQPVFSAACWLYR